MALPGSSGGARYKQSLETVLSNLNKEIRAIQDRGTKGLLLSAAYIRRQTETTPPLTPVDLGNLRASWFTVSSKGKVQGGETAYGKSFKGPQGSKIQMDYQIAITESQGMANRLASIGAKRFVVFGYGANYAGFVHEMIGADFKRPGSDNKWLEEHIKRNIRTILFIIATEVKIPKGKKWRPSK